MRNIDENIIFLFKSDTAVTKPTFVTKTAATQGGRADVVARVISSFSRIPKEIKDKSALLLLLRGPPSPPTLLTISGKKIPVLNELEAIEYLLNLLRKGGNKINLSKILDFYQKKSYNIIILDEKGDFIFNKNLHNKNIFVIGDQKGFSYHDYIIFKRRKASFVSLGKKAYLSSQCITILGWILYQYSIISSSKNLFLRK